ETVAENRLGEVEKANEKTTQAFDELRRKQRQTEEALNLHRIALADRAWETNDVGQADRLLDECPDDLRQWEWHYLKRRCHRELLKLRFSHTPVHTVAFSPDGSRILGGYGPRAKVYDAATGQELLNHLEKGVDGKAM